MTVAIVLAAGLGTRLRPSTERCPKPLIPVGGIEPLFFAMHAAWLQGVRRFIVNAHYLSEQIEASLRDWHDLLPDSEIRCEVERPEILGTGGALINIAKKHSNFLSGRNVLILNGDTLAQIDLSRLGQMSGVDISFAISEDESHLAKYGPLWIDDGDASFIAVGRARPASPRARATHFLGTQCFSRRVMEALAGEEFAVRSCDLFSAIYAPLMARGFKAVATRYFSQTAPGGKGDFWFDMTTSAHLLEAQRHVLNTLTDVDSPWAKCLAARFPKVRSVERGVYVSATPDQLAKVKLHSPSVFVVENARTVIGKHLELGPSSTFIVAIGCPAVSASDARASDCVFLVRSGSSVGTKSEVHNEIVID